MGTPLLRDTQMRVKHFCVGRFAPVANIVRNDGYVESRGIQKISMKLGEIFKTRREELQLTQQHVADVVGTDAGNISRIENEKQGLSEEMIYSLSKALDLAIELRPRLRINEPIADYKSHPEPVISSVRIVPVVTWAQAATWRQDVEVLDRSLVDDWVPCPMSCSNYTFALRVRGPSMEPLFHDGDLIFVDPERVPANRSYVVVRLADSEEADFKQLVIEGPRQFLKALNPAWPDPMVEINGNAAICGVVFFKGTSV